jgi:hypothetical protein
MYLLGEFRTRKERERERERESKGTSIAFRHFHLSSAQLDFAVCHLSNAWTITSILIKSEKNLKNIYRYIVKLIYFKFHSI